MQHSGFTMVIVARITLCVACIFLQIGILHSASFDQAKIDSFMNAALACRQDANPGLTVSVVKDGQVMFAKGYGVADLSTGRKVTNRTLFGMAALSKAFTSALMVKLLHDRNMSIYTKPGDVLPEGFMYNDTEFTTYATLRDLMSHCLGVPENRGLRFDPTLTRKEAARRIRYFKPIHKFRVGYVYNSMHFGILSYINEVLGGGTFEDLIQQHIYTPLGMSDSDFTLTVDRTKKDVARGYTDDPYTDQVFPVPEEVNRQWAVYGGSSGIMSSSTDMAKWMLMNLNGGKNQNGEVVIRAEDLLMTHTEQTAIPSSTMEKYFHRPKGPFTFTQTGYAFGWMKGFYKGYRLLLHSGTTYGYTSFLTLIPEVNLGIFTSMSGWDTNSITRILLHSFLADEFLGEDHSINETTICTYPEPWYPAKHYQASLDTTIPAARPVSDYVGTYNNIAYGNLVVSINTTVNQLQLFNIV